MLIQCTFVNWRYKHHIYVGLYLPPSPPPWNYSDWLCVFCFRPLEERGGRAERKQKIWRGVMWGGDWALDWIWYVSWGVRQCLILLWNPGLPPFIGGSQCLNLVELPYFPKKKSSDCLKLGLSWFQVLVNLCTFTFLSILFALPTSLLTKPYRSVIWFP